MIFRQFLTVTAAMLVVGCLHAQGEWPQFRGPDGQGHAPRPLPLQWSETENVTWKTEIHDRGWSSPVIWGNQVWVSTATEDGKELFALCIDSNSGEVLRDMNLFHVPNPQFAHKFNSYASPTPVIEEGRIYVTFGSPGTACIDTHTGKVLWERRDFDVNHFRGAGSSPILYQNLLIMNFDGSDNQFVVALDKDSGHTVWKVNRSIDFQDLNEEGEPMAEGDFRKAFSTPHVTGLPGYPLLLSSGAKAHYGYHPMTGEEYWRIEERSSHSASTRPVVGGGLIYVPSGFPQGTLIAIEPGSADNRSNAQRVWDVTRSVPNKPSVIFHEGNLFMVSDGGIATCLDAKDGEIHWQHRVGGNFSSSPIEADGKIYFCNEEGETTVIEASAEEYREIAVNRLENGFMASPAAAGNTLILRTKTHLYRID